MHDFGLRRQVAAMALLVILIMSLATRTWDVSVLCGALFLYVGADRLGLMNPVARWRVGWRLLFELTLFVLLAGTVLAVSRHITVFGVAVYAVVALVWLPLRWRSLKRSWQTAH